MNDIGSDRPDPTRQDTVDDRFESWKAIAVYLGKDVSTVQRWEKQAGLPVHRHSEGSVRNVNAYQSELDAWQSQDRALPANGDTGASSESNGDLSPARTSLAPRRRSPAWVATAAVLTAIAVGGIWVLLQTGGPSRDAQAVINMPFEQDDYVLIAQFDNLTGEPLFDEGTLELALERALSESGLLHVTPPERVEDALRLMQRPLDTVIDRLVGREVALRDGAVRVVLAGTIEIFGPGYAVTMELIDPHVGRVLHSVREEAAHEADVTHAIYRQASRVRELLGEDLPPIESREHQLEKVTTPSLRALQLYTRGYWLYRRGNRPASKELFQLAVAEDPSFAAAHQMLGYAVRDTPARRRPIEEWLPHFERAVDLAAGTTERDRLFIEGSYFSVTRQFEHAIPKYEALLDLQPDHYFAMTNVRGAYRRLGQDPPVELVLRHADARPNNPRLQGIAATVLLETSQLSRAKIYVDRARALVEAEVVDDERTHLLVAFFPTYEYWIDGAIDETFREVERLSRLETVQESLSERHDRAVGQFSMALGQLGKAKERFDRLPETYRPLFLAGLAASLDDQRSLREQVTAMLARDPRDSHPVLQVRAGLSPDPVALEAEPQGRRQLVAGTVAFRQGEWSDAIASLEPGVDWARLQPSVLPDDVLPFCGIAGGGIFQNRRRDPCD